MAATPIAETGRRSRITTRNAVLDWRAGQAHAWTLLVAGTDREDAGRRADLRRDADRQPPDPPADLLGRARELALDRLPTLLEVTASIGDGSARSASTSTSKPG
jgi:hypothetical protein